MTAPGLARQLLRARDLADARYAEPLTVAELARRLERATALLRVTDWLVAEVCFAVGAGSLGSFTTSFTRVCGCSPTAYRRSWPSAARAVRIPSCVAMVFARPQNRTFREDGTAARP